MKTILVLLVIAFVAGCPPPYLEEVLDQCMRERLFKECLERIPTGPTSVVNNDWDEVVEACDYSAQQMSKRTRPHVAPNCTVEIR